jgi:hypothetical protein
MYSEFRMARDEIRKRVYRRARSGTPTPDIVREIEQAEDDPPARSTIYAWARAARGGVDTSGGWSLVRDQSGRPDLALRVAFALDEGWRGEVTIQRGLHEAGLAGTAKAILAVPRPRLTNGDAEWLARLGDALPDPGTDFQALSDLLSLARGYRAAAASGDERELTLLDTQAGLIQFVGWADYHRMMES